MIGKFGKFDAGVFVDGARCRGAAMPCDDSGDSFQRGAVLPEYYDEEKFKRGQKFFHDHIFSMLFSKFLGLCVLLSHTKTHTFLKGTNMSSEPKTAYKRYMSTIFHMCIWYDEDLRPGSKLWASLSEVRKKHNAASNAAHAKGRQRIDQFDMAITQLGFISLVLVRPKLVGIHDPDEKDVEAFVHLWRVIGHTIGMEDQYNICRESVGETREICEVMLQKILKPEVASMKRDFLQLATALVEGLWCFNPAINDIDVIMAYVYHIFELPIETLNLTFCKKLHLYFYYVVMAILKYSIFCTFFNANIYMALWIMKIYPFLAHYKFGNKSPVTILNKN